MNLFSSHKQMMVEKDRALVGRDTPMPVPDTHFVLGTPLVPPFPAGLQQIVFAMGCFWGAERAFFETEGVYTTAVGYANGYTPNPTYEEVCTGKTGHTEAVLVVFDPKLVRFERLLAVFFEHHDPTQYMRQGNDIGTQYRSGIYTTSDTQRTSAEAVAKQYGEMLEGAGFGEIATEIEPLTHFYYAESYHQQYLAKNPNGYCGLGGTGLSCPVGVIGTSP